MFPSLRGGNDNPGQVEWMHGEVRDILAARDHLASLPYVDPDRIFLGGHSTGGTLVYLVTESSDAFRATFSFGPTVTGTSFGSDLTLIDFADNSPEMLSLSSRGRTLATRMRSPVYWSKDVRTPLYVFEGAVRGNADSLAVLDKYSHNPKISFHLVDWASHFNILAPFNEMIADKIINDSGQGTFSISQGAIDGVKP